jgi:predicted lipase
MKHDTIIDMLHITTLVYNYNEKMSNKTTVDEFTDLFGADIQFVELLNKYPKGRIINFITDLETDVQVGVTINYISKRICVAFRGTDSLKDWYYNLQIKKYCIKGDIRVHKGYCSQLFVSNLYHRLSNQIQQLLHVNPEYKLFITGHSAGGALATLFGYLLSSEIPKKEINIVSFASPRIGNYAFKCDFENKPNLIHHRVTNRNDIVTATPIFRYWHVGRKVYIRSKKTSLCCCLNVWDHTTDAYYKNLLDFIEPTVLCDSSIPFGHDTAYNYQPFYKTIQVRALSV